MKDIREVLYELKDYCENETCRTCKISDWCDEIGDEPLTIEIDHKLNELD